MDFLSKILHRNSSESRTNGTDPEVVYSPLCPPVTNYISSPTFQPPPSTDRQVQGTLASDSPKATRLVKEEEEEEVHNQSTYTEPSTRDPLAICTHVTVD